MTKFLLLGGIFFLSLTCLSQQSAEIERLLLHLSGKSEGIAKDSCVMHIASDRIKALPILADKFTDSTLSLVYSDCKQRYLTIGELAIIIADQIEVMPYFTITGVENCTLEFCKNNPNLIEYYFDYKYDGLRIFEYQNRYKKWLISKERRKWIKAGPRRIKTM